MYNASMVNGDMDENQLQHALETNITDKQVQLDKLQLHIQKLNFEL